MTSAKASAQAASTAAGSPTVDATFAATTSSTKEMLKVTTAADGNFKGEDGSSNGQWNSSNNARRRNMDELDALRTTVLKVPDFPA